MFLFGKNESDRIYIGNKHILRIYNGLVLWYKYSREIPLKTISKLFSKATATLEMAIAGAMAAIGKASSGSDAKITLDATVKPKAEGKAFSGTEVKGGAGHTAKIKADDMSFSVTEAELTDHSGNIKPEEQHIVLTDIAQAEAGTAQPQETENHILLTQSVPTASKGQTMDTAKQDMHMHLNVKATGVAGHAKAQKAETHSLFSYVKPTMLAQKIIPKPQVVKALFKDIASFGAGHAKPNSAEDKMFFTAEKSTLNFGYAIPKAEEQKMHISATATGGAGHAKGNSAEAKHLLTDFAQIAGETQDVTAETGANVCSEALFETTHGSGIKAENGGISGADSKVYIPKKKLDIYNAGGISGTETSVYKPDKLLKTDELIKSGNFTRLFRIVCMSATTTANLITQPPMFKYVFLGASGGGISSNTGILDTATYEELFGWAVQYDNVLYIYQANTAAQAENVLTVDSGNIEAWHTQTDNVLFINIASTAEQTETQLEIDMLSQLPLEEWAVQTDNVLLINGIVENTDMGVS